MQALKNLGYTAFAIGIAFVLLSLKEEYDLFATYDTKTADFIMALICYFILICVAYLFEPDVIRE